jgi:hypothetical protein
MKDYEFKKRLAYAMSSHKNGYHEKAAEILDLLADALLYASAYNKELDDALFIVRKLYKKTGRETTKFLCMRIREDREQALTCSLTEELAALFLLDGRQEEKEDKAARLVAFIKRDNKLLEALKKNTSNQYLNRLLVNTALQAKGAKLKKFYNLNKHLF